MSRRLFARGRLIHPSHRSAGLVSGATLAVALLAAGTLTAHATAPAPPPANARLDYQIGGDYPLPVGVRVVSRDWFAGRALGGDRYSICYINAFQTQGNEAGVNRPDERSSWPPDLVLTELGVDPNWGGEYLIDISTARKRSRAAAWLRPMIDTCAAKGFQAVEYDNLDSWTRFDGTPVSGQVPFGKRHAVAYAELLTDCAHRKGLAVGQKNTSDLGRRNSLGVIGFDFAIAEECGRYDECTDYTDVFGSHVVAIEYRDADFRKACAAIGSSIAVVRRDRNVTKPGSATYRFATC